MNDHTQGEWKYGIRSDGSIWWSRGDPMTGPHYQSDFYGPEADARLSCAAPRLLAALECCCEVMLCHGVPINLEHPERIALNAARAAIAKATGGAS